MGQVIDRYKLNLFCRCLECEQYKGAKNDFVKYCGAYKTGIPPEIWNGRNVECKHFAENKKNN